MATPGAILKPYEQGLHARAEHTSSAAFGRARFDALDAEGAELALADALAHATAGS